MDAVHALVVTESTADDPIWYAARTTGLYRSFDNGQNWRSAYGSLSLDGPLTTASIAVSPDFASDRTVFAGALGGILRSNDGGTTWSVSNLPEPLPFIVSLVVSPNYEMDGLVFAGTLEDGVFRSWDRGETWASWNFGLLDLSVYSMAASPNFASDDTLFVAVESGIFRSTNGGRAWRETAFPIDAAPVLGLAISPEFAEDQTIFAGSEARGVFRSQDGGGTWTEIGPCDMNASVDYMLLWQPASSAQHIVAVTNRQIFVTDGPDNSWQTTFAVDSDSVGEITAAILFEHDEHATILVGMNDGAVRSVPLYADQCRNKGNSDV